MFKNISRKEKELLAITAPSAVIALVSTVAHGQIPFDTFAYFWYALMQVIFCMAMLIYIYKHYGKGSKQN